MGIPDQQNWFEAVWNRVQSDLRDSMDDRRYEFWVKPIRLVSANSDRFVLSCLTHETRDRLVSRFGAKIAELVQLHAQKPMPIDFVVESKPQLVGDSESPAEERSAGGGWVEGYPPLGPRSIVLTAESGFGTLVVVPSGDSGGDTAQMQVPPVVYRRLTIEDLKRQTAAFYGIRITDLMSKSRERAVVVPRQVAIYLCRTMLERSYPQIARRFLRDHTSCIHAVQKIRRLIEENPQFALEVETLRQAIRAWSMQAGEAPTLQ